MLEESGDGVLGEESNHRYFWQEVTYFMLEVSGDGVLGEESNHRYFRQHVK